MFIKNPKTLLLIFLLTICLTFDSFAQSEGREKDSTNFPGVATDLPKPPAILYSETVDLQGCIPMYRQKRFVINNKETYLKNIRNDTQTEKCIASAESIDFQNNSYIGLQIYSGYCRYPKGLQHELLKDNANKKYILNVRYINPEGQVCRALSRYDLWVKVPKLQEGFEVTFKITPKPHTLKKSKN